MSHAAASTATSRSRCPTAESHRKHRLSPATFYRLNAKHGGLRYRRHGACGWPKANLCTNMRAGDVPETLDLDLAASGCETATVLHKARLLSDNGPS